MKLGTTRHYKCSPILDSCRICQDVDYAKKPSKDRIVPQCHFTMILATHAKVKLRRSIDYIEWNRLRQYLSPCPATDNIAPVTHVLRIIEHVSRRIYRFAFSILNCLVVMINSFITISTFPKICHAINDYPASGLKGRRNSKKNEIGFVETCHAAELVIDFLYHALWI